MPERPKAWIRQANADLDASRAHVGPECYRRYWLQQACEKGIKALGLVLWSGPASEEARFNRLFLHKHSPLVALSQEPDLPKSLHRLLRELETELGQIDGMEVLRKIDSTTPTTDPAGVSYRYPFIDRSGIEIAPVDWTAAEWDEYQGNAKGASAAIKRFLRSVEDRLRRDRTLN